MFNFKMTRQLVEKELKHEEKIEHYIEGKSAIKTSAGTELIDTGMAVTNQGRAIYVTNPVCEKGSATKVSADKINKSALSPDKATLSFEAEDVCYELSQIPKDPDPKKILDFIGDRRKEAEEKAKKDQQLWFAIKNTGLQPFTVQVEPQPSAKK